MSYSSQYADANTQFQPSVDNTYHDQVENVDMTLREVQAAGGTITRVRLLAEMGRRDISYIHATLPGSRRGCAGHQLADGGPSPVCGECNTKTRGRIVRVNLNQCPGTTLIPANRVKSTFIEWAKAEGVYAKGLGLLDEANWSVLH